MKKNSYCLDKNILSITTDCGTFKFKIENNSITSYAEKIAKTMVKELERLDNPQETTSPYAALLLANLNICEKYVKLEDKYARLEKELEAIKTRSGKFPHAIDHSNDNIFPQKEDIKPQQPTSKENDPKDKTENFPANEADNIDITPANGEKNSLSTQPQNKFSKSITKPDQSSQTQSFKTDLPSPDRASHTQNSKDEDGKITAHNLLCSFKETTHESIDQADNKKEVSHKKDQNISTPTVFKEKTPGHSPETEPVDQSAHLSVAETASDTLSPSEITARQRKAELDEPQGMPSPLSTSQAPQSSSFPINLPDANYHHVADKTLQNKGEFQLPSLSFLQKSRQKTEIDHHGIRRDAELLEQKLGYFGIKGEVMGVSPGPVITTFEYKPAPGIKISKIVNLADDLALALSAFSIRIVAPIPGKDVMGVEIPNEKKSLVPFIDIVSSDDFINSKSKIPICLGKDIVGNPVVVELQEMPHLLIAGATGTGKSVALNALITSILYKSTPDEVKFLMIDPKRIELSFYNEIPHLITPVITDMKKANIALQWMVREMERRYDLLADMKVRNIEQYNTKLKIIDPAELDREEIHEFMPYFVIIIDELADLMMTASRDIEFSLTRLAQMARAAGIHLILATQRPSVDVLTGIIKANFPTRISFQVSSKTDSRTIIDSNGAETLLGKGDMLFVPPGTASLTRVHGTYLSEQELVRITDFIKAQRQPDYLLDVITEKEEEPDSNDFRDDEYDEKYNEALQYVIATRQASISGIQRALRVGYNRAARIIDLMEKKGIVGPSDGVKPRQVLTNKPQ